MAVVRLKLANGRQTWGDASNPEVIKEIEKQYNSKVVEADGKMFASGGLTEKQQEKVGKVMHEFKEGKLHSGSKEGPIVKDRKQAIAIALSEANNSPKYTTGGKIQVDAYDEEKYPSGIEYLRSIITKYFGPKNIHYSSADWGGIDNWTIKGTKHYGIFIVIDDNQNVILMERQFDEQSDENVDTEIAQADPDDTNGLEKLFEKAMEIKNNSTEKAKKGTLTKGIESRVAEVNELIKQGNEKGIEVTDKSGTWQSPMKYKPFTYSNGVLYEQYEELDLYKANKGQGREWKLVKNKYTKSGDGIDTQKAVLTSVARMYRNALKSIENYGYYDKGGKTRTIQFKYGGDTKFNLVGNEKIKDLSFKIKVEEMPKKEGIILHEKVTIEEWTMEGAGVKEGQKIKFQPFHLIYGKNSMAIFDAFGIDETAGLTREGCEKKLKELNYNEKNGAYIAGLTNWANDQLYMFFNVTRLNFEGFASRVLPHESLHLARALITILDNKFVRENQGKGEWWANPKAQFVDMNDDYEEFFAETLERCTAIAMDGWFRATGSRCFENGGSTGEMKMLWYVTDANNNVKNISTSISQAELFLANSLKYNGAINYVKVPLSDWNAEKINTSNIKQIAKNFWQKYEDGGQTGGTSDSSMPGTDDVFLGGTMASSMARRGKKVTEKMYKIVDIDGAGDNKVYSASEIIDYANTITHYERMDNDEPEITDFATAKRVIELEGDYKVKQIASNGTMTELSDLYFVKDKYGNLTGIYNKNNINSVGLKKLDKTEGQTIEDFINGSIVGDMFYGEGFTIENIGHDIMATGGMIDGHPYLHYDEVEGNYMLKNAILVKKPITKYQKEVEPDYFIVQLTYDKTSNDFMVDWYGTNSKGSHAYHKDFASAKKHMINVIKYIRNEWDIADVRYDVEYDEYNDADFGKGYSAPEVKAERGMVINENAEMILNNNKQIAHHTKELAEVVNKDTHVPAWVVAKTFRSATDLSDVTHYLEGNSNNFAKGGWTEYLDKAKNYGKRAYQVAKENYGKAKAYTQQKIRDKQKQIALDVLYETKENLATGRDEHIAMEKAFHIVDEKFAGGGSTDTFITPKGRKVEYKGRNKNGKYVYNWIDIPSHYLEVIGNGGQFMNKITPEMADKMIDDKIENYNKFKDEKFAGGGPVKTFKQGEKVKVNGKIAEIVRYDKESGSYVVYTGKYESEFVSPENITKFAGGGPVKNANNKVTIELITDENEPEHLQYGVFDHYGTLIEPGFEDFNSATTWANEQGYNTDTKAEKGTKASDKIKVAFYKWGEYQGDEEIDLIDLPERELTSDELMGFDIREEDENKHFYASELDIDDTNVEEEGYGVKRAYATDKQYN